MALNPHAVNLATKGRLGVATVTATRGIIPEVDPTNPDRNFCDYPHAVNVATKGNLSDAHITGVKGKIPKICDLTPPIPGYCDYPHAVKLATMGRLGATVGTATRGRVLRICIEEFPVRTTGPGRRGFRKEEEKKKCIRITVFAYGEKFVSEHCVEKDRIVKASDVEVRDIGNKKISIKLKGIKKS